VRLEVGHPGWEAVALGIRDEYNEVLVNLSDYVVVIFVVWIITCAVQLIGCQLEIRRDVAELRWTGLSNMGVEAVMPAGPPSVKHLLFD